MRFHSSRVLVTCEHASNRLPEAYGTLGLSAASLASHVAWDIGAAQLAETLAKRIGCPCILGRYSRLLVDLNRSESSRSLILSRNHGLDIAGNLDIDAAERRRRIEIYHRPYHAEVERIVRDKIASGGPCLHVSVHSFTPSLDGTNHRDCDIGVLYHTDRLRERAVASLIRDDLSRSPLRIRMNYPYRGTLDGVQTRLKKMLNDTTYIGIQFEVVDTIYRDEVRSQQITDVICSALLEQIEGSAKEAV